MMMKKGKIALMVFLMALFCLSFGCGEKDKAVRCKDVLETSISKLDHKSFNLVKGYEDELYKDSFPKLYGIKWDSIEDGAIAYIENGGLADEISIVRLKKSEDISLAKDKFQNRVKERLAVFQGYKPEEAYKLKNALIMSHGKYVALIISEDRETIELEIRNSISNKKID